MRLRDSYHAGPAGPVLPTGELTRLGRRLPGAHQRRASAGEGLGVEIGQRGETGHEGQAAKATEADERAFVVIRVVVGDLLGGGKRRPQSGEPRHSVRAMMHAHSSARPACKPERHMAQNGEFEQIDPPDRLACPPVKRRLSLLVLLLGLALGGCAIDNGPSSYTADVATNYDKACRDASTARLGAEGAAAYCKCTFDELKVTVPFDVFNEFDDYVREKAGDTVNSRADLEARFGATVLPVLDKCVAALPAGPSAPSTTAAVTATTPSTTTR